MTYALIDNATLTATQRVLGEITVKNTDTINGDLVAFENLVQAILFYDDLICIDNYKDEHKSDRTKKFNYNRFLSPDQYDLDKVQKQSEKESKLIKPEIRGGEFADDDFKKLLEQLKLNMICTWDMRSSVHYLTMKMLGQRGTKEYIKYSEISSAIFNELSDAADTKGRWSSSATLISSNGHVHTNEEFEKQTNELGGVSRQLEMFIASLNWLAFKSIYYSIAAKHLRADSFIHPIRHAYQIHWMKKTGAFGHDFTSRLIKNLSDKVSTTTSEITHHGSLATVSLDIPIFSAWLANEADGVEHSIQAALELKKADHFVTARETIKEIRLAYDENDLPKGNAKSTKLQSDLAKIAADLKHEYGVSSSQGIQVSKLVKVVNSALSVAGVPPFIPEFEATINTPEFMKNNSTKAFSTIFKNITNELTSMERLGGYRDTLASKFQIDDELYVEPKTEDPEYKNIKSHWKKPM